MSGARSAARLAAPLAALVAASVALGGCGGGDPGPEPSAAGASDGPGGDARPVVPGGTVSPEASGSTGSSPGAGSSRSRPAERGMPVVGAHHRQDDVLRRIPGPADGACVAVGDRRDVRSGGFAAGPFDTARQGYSPRYGDDQVIRLYLVPEHAEPMSGVTVTARRSGSAEVVRQRVTDGSDADEFRFYDVQLALPRAGTWQVRAVAGQDQGCWTIVLG